MKKTAVIYTPKYLNHNPGRNHPESPERLKVIMKELDHSGLFKTGQCSLVEPEPAGIENLKLVHEPDHITLAKQCCASGGGLLEPLFDPLAITLVHTTLWDSASSTTSP